MKKDKKQKRYFCDYWYGTEGVFPIAPFLIILVSLLVVVPVCGKIVYDSLITEYGSALNSYSKSKYEYLDEIADNIIHEGVGIDMMALPDDVVSYELIKKDDGIIFIYCLDNNKDIQYAISAKMTVKLSNNYEIISKTPNASSEEDYIDNVKRLVFSDSVTVALTIWLVFTIVITIVVTAVAYNSKSKKDRNLY